MNSEIKRIDNLIEDTDWMLFGLKDSEVAYNDEIRYIAGELSGQELLFCNACFVSMNYMYDKMFQAEIEEFVEESIGFDENGNAEFVFDPTDKRIKYVSQSDLSVVMQYYLMTLGFVLDEEKSFLATGKYFAARELINSPLVALPENVKTDKKLIIESINQKLQDERLW